MNTTLGVIAENTFSYFDATEKQAEHFYHAFVLGLIVDLKDRYEIRSNRESGFGRYDICMFPKNPEDPGLLLEFKTMESDKEKDLEATCAKALLQIREKKYSNDLKERGVASTNIFCYAFAFTGKKLLICGGSEEEIDWVHLSKA